MWVSRRSRFYPEPGRLCAFAPLRENLSQTHLIAGDYKMRYRRFGGTGWEVSEIGYGMWGMASWSNSDDDESLQSLQAAVDRGCNFFDTAYAYGNGRSEGLLGQIVRANPGKRLYTATKIPPKNLKWPATPEYTLAES